MLTTKKEYRDVNTQSTEIMGPLASVPDLTQFGNFFDADKSLCLSKALAPAMHPAPRRRLLRSPPPNLEIHQGSTSSPLLHPRPLTPARAREA